MIDRFSFHLQLAPDVPPQETFVFHWKAITNYFIEATGSKPYLFTFLNYSTFLYVKMFEYENMNFAMRIFFGRHRVPIFVDGTSRVQFTNIPNETCFINIL